jgi:hypothetical protein
MYYKFTLSSLHLATYTLVIKLEWIELISNLKLIKNCVFCLKNILILNRVIRV